jgi:hypothetical protein
LFAILFSFVCSFFFCLRSVFFSWTVPEGYVDEAEEAGRGGAGQRGGEVAVEDFEERVLSSGTDARDAALQQQQQRFAAAVAGQQGAAVRVNRYGSVDVSGSSAGCVGHRMRALARLSPTFPFSRCLPVYLTPRPHRTTLTLSQLLLRPRRPRHRVGARRR